MNDSMFEDEASEKLFGIIQMLQRSALMNMGGIADAEGMIHFDLGEAKAAIDLLDALQEKTKGNLSDTETALFRGIISEVKMNFIRAPKDQANVEAEMERQAELQQTFTNPANAPAETLVNDSADEQE
jgi:hypothetical protein